MNEPLACVHSLRGNQSPRSSNQAWPYAHVVRCWLLRQPSICIQLPLRRAFVVLGALAGTPGFHDGVGTRSGHSRVCTCRPPETRMTQLIVGLRSEWWYRYATGSSTGRSPTSPSSAVEFRGTAFSGPAVTMSAIILTLFAAVLLYGAWKVLHNYFVPSILDNVPGPKSTSLITGASDRHYAADGTSQMSC